jgi:DNA-binding transcriptional MerR regulator
MDALLTQAEVAERLRRPVATLRFWRHKGTGPRSANVGGRVLYRQSDVEAWLEKQFRPQ